MPKVVALYYLSRFFHHLNFFWAVDKLYFSSQGITPFQISLLLAVWSLYSLVFEVPSGAIADRWSRKWVMVIGQAFHMLSYFIWIFFGGFWWFLVGYLFRGTGGFLESGTKEALLYDHLKALNKHTQYEKYLGKLWLVTTSAFLIASAGAGYVAAHWSFMIVLVMTTISNLLALVVVIMIPDAPKSVSTDEMSYFTFIRQSFSKALRYPLLMQAIFYTMTVLAVDGVMDEYDQLYVRDIGLPLAAMGVWWVMRMSMEGLAGMVAHKFKTWGRDLALEGIAVITAVLLLMASLIDSLFMLPVLAICFFFFATAVILNEARIQTYIESHERATINSINALLKETVAIVIGLSYGFVANAVNPRIGLLVFVGVLVVYIVVVKVGIKKTSTTF